MKAPDKTMAPSLVVKGLTPTARAASSLSRRACNCAPKREWRNHVVTSMASTKNASVTSTKPRRESNCICIKPGCSGSIKPTPPPVKSSDTARMRKTSAKAKVTKAKYEPFKP